MLKNYFKIAWRKLWKNRLYSFVNIAGLTAGLASCLLIGVYLWNELTYDTFHKNADRIVRVVMEHQVGNAPEKFAVTGTKVGPQFKRSFPAVEEYVRTMKSGNIFNYNNQLFQEDNILYADAPFFEVFSFPLIRGNATEVLSSPDKIVITQAAQKKYFGSDDPVGKVIKIGTKTYMVSGIAANTPLNSQIKFDFVMPFSALNASKSEEWFTANYVTYLLLKHPNDIKPLQSQINTFMSNVSRGELKMTGKEYLTEDLEPLTSVHLHSSETGFEPNGNITYIYVLLSVALLTLFIAAVNYTNLSVAQSAGRSAEISIRKVLGAGRVQLFRQFTGESFVYTTLAALLAVVIAVALLPQFNTIAGKEFTTAELLTPASLTCLLLFSMFIGFIAAAYPSFLLSNTKIIKLLKSGFSFSGNNNTVRHSLIIFQFVISFFLIVSTLVIVGQLNYLRTRDIGYNRNNVIVLPIDWQLTPMVASLKTQIKAIPQVQGVSVANSSPVQVGWGDAISTNDGKKVMVNCIPADEDFAPMFKLKMLAGSNFTHADEMLMDTTNQGKNYRYTFMINETAAKALGWTPEQALGKTIAKGNPGTIKAVVKDFNFRSMHDPITPLVLFLDHSNTNGIFVKVSARNIPAVLHGLESVWKQNINNRPFQYHFLDEDFNAMYVSEQRTANVFKSFSILAILLACLGLFALTAYTVLNKTKEIGIRKVLGASVSSITLMLSKNFLRLVLVAILIASPIAWWAMNKWLQDFAYRIHIQWYIYVLAGLATIVIAFVTVSFQAVKAALDNPVKSLRSE